MRLNRVRQEYRGRVSLRVRPFPLEVNGGEAAPRDILEQEWWLAALQEPDARFAPYPGDDWPETTLPAFEAVWSASRQDEEAAHEYDLRIRTAFFGEGRNIGRPDVLLDLAREVGLDAERIEQEVGSGEARRAVLEERRLGRERYGVRGTPTVMLPDGTRITPPIAFPRMRNRRIVGVGSLPCCGEGCLDATREMFERALRSGGGV